jgi:hypothetical protein
MLQIYIANYLDAIVLQEIISRNLLQSILREIYAGLYNFIFGMKSKSLMWRVKRGRLWAIAVAAIRASGI